MIAESTLKNVTENQLSDVCGDMDDSSPLLVSSVIHTHILFDSLVYISPSKMATTKKETAYEHYHFGISIWTATVTQSATRLLDGGSF